MASIFAAQAEEAFTKYECELHFTGRVLAGVPKDAKLMEGWLRSKAGITDEEELRVMMARALRDLGAEVSEGATFEEIEQASASIADTKSCAFKRNGAGPYLEGRQLKAALKEAINVAYPKTAWGKTGKGSKNYLAERVFVDNEHLLLEDASDDGVEFIVKHISDRGGKRSALGYYEYSDKPRIGCSVSVLDDCFKSNEWARIWVAAERLGLGAMRSQGFGPFEVVRWERAK